MKYTPGPWKYDYGLVPPDGPHRYSEVTVEDGNHIIANVNEFLDGHENGYLIAAAPDLLEALKTMYAAMKAYEMEVDESPPYKHRAMTLRAHEAIAKAEGKEGA